MPCRTHVSSRHNREGTRVWGYEVAHGRRGGGEGGLFCCCSKWRCFFQQGFSYCLFVCLFVCLPGRRRGTRREEEHSHTHALLPCTSPFPLTPGILTVMAQQGNTTLANSSDSRAHGVKKTRSSATADRLAGLWKAAIGGREGRGVVVGRGIFFRMLFLDVVVFFVFSFSCVCVCFFSAFAPSFSRRASRVGRERGRARLLCCFFPRFFFSPSQSRCRIRRRPSSG